MSKSARELELKFAITGEQLERIRKLASLDGIAIGKAAKQTLRSTYFDTPDLGLHGKGLTLRLRNVGKTWHQTVKAETRVMGGVSHPIEVETVVRSRKIELEAVTDRKIRGKLIKAIGSERLVPVFEAVIERTQRQLRAAEGSGIELSLDKGTIKAGDRTSEICEAELELKSGSPRQLLAVISQVFAADDLVLSRLSKSEIGYGLLRRNKPLLLSPLKSQSIKLKRGDHCEDALREVFHSVTRQILHNWQVLLDSDDSEAAHQMRVGLRRLRSALKVFKPLIRDDAILSMDQKARDLARLVGEIREADVLVEDVIEPLVAETGAELPLAPLLALLDERRDSKRADLRTKLQHRDMVTLQVELALLPAMVSHAARQKRKSRMSKPAKSFARNALAKCWRRVEKRGSRLDKLNETERHVLRRDLKLMRYAVEFFQPLFPPRKSQRLLARLKRVLDLFGALNDVVDARKLTAVKPGVAWPGPDVQGAIGYVIGWHTAHTQDISRNARAEWKRLKKTPRFWE